MQSLQCKSSVLYRERQSFCSLSEGPSPFSQAHLYIQVQREGNPRRCPGRDSVGVYGIYTHTHTHTHTHRHAHNTCSFAFFAHLWNQACLFASYIYFLETFKASHLIAHSNSFFFFPICKHKGSFPSSNISGTHSERSPVIQGVMSLCRNAKHPCQLLQGSHHLLKEVLLLPSFCYCFLHIK